MVTLLVTNLVDSYGGPAGTTITWEVSIDQLLKFMNFYADFDMPLAFRIRPTLDTRGRAAFDRLS